MKIFNQLLLGIAMGLVFFFSILFMLSFDSYGMPNPTGQTEVNEYAEIFRTMSNEDLQHLRHVVQAECGNTNPECIEATVCVVLNRVLSGKWPNTISDVVNQKRQFAVRGYMWKKEPNLMVDEAISRVRIHGAKIIRDRLAELGWDFEATAYDCFASKKQSMGTCHIWFGEVDENGRPIKGKGHWVAISK